MGGMDRRGIPSQGHSVRTGLDQVRVPISCVSSYLLKKGTLRVLHLSV